MDKRSSNEPTGVRTEPGWIRLWWAAARRCPNCGGRPVFRSFLNQVAVCPSCRLRLDRGEADFFIGAYTLNLIVAELLVAFGALSVLLLSWPDVPWRRLTWGLVALMVVAPILFYPWSRQFWLAVDLLLRPAEPSEYARDTDLDTPSTTVA